jgi:hypothetical protein
MVLMVVLRQDAQLRFPMSGGQGSRQSSRFSAIFATRKPFAIKAELRNLLPSYNSHEFRASARGNEKALLGVAIKALEVVREDGKSLTSRNAFSLVSDSLSMMDRNAVGRLAGSVTAALKESPSVSDSSDAVKVLAKMLPRLDGNRRSNVEAAVADACFEGTVSTDAKQEFDMAKTGGSLGRNVVMDVVAEPVSEPAMA